MLIFLTLICCSKNTKTFMHQSSNPKMFLRKSVLKICSKFTGEHPCRSAISIKLFCNFIEIALRHGRSPVNLLHIFRTPFPRNTFWWLLVMQVTWGNIIDKLEAWLSVVKGEIVFHQKATKQNLYSCGLLFQINVFTSWSPVDEPYLAF